MLTLVEVLSARGDVLSLVPGDDEQGLQLQSIEGLDPVKATLVSSSYANVDGAYYHDARREPRNITMRVGLEVGHESKSVEQLRRELYRYFMPKSQVFLRFYSDSGLNTWIAGRVEDTKAPLFTNEPAVDISVLCFNPDLNEMLPTTFAEESGSVSDPFFLEYTGDVDTGFEMQFTVVDSMDDLLFYNVSNNASLTQKFQLLDLNLTAGQKLYINTTKGAKEITKIDTDSSGTRTSLLYTLTDDSVWPSLQPGQNKLFVLTTLEHPFTITYYGKHGGM